MRSQAMNSLEEVKKPSRNEQKVAAASYDAIESLIQQISANKTEIEIEIEDSKDQIVIPIRALKLLGDILKSMSQGKPISIVPISTEVSTQKAAEILGCSRPHLVKLLEDGKIEYTKVGKHRRLKFLDVQKYRVEMKENQKKHIIDIMNFDQEIGLYDS